MTYLVNKILPNILSRFITGFRAQNHKGGSFQKGGWFKCNLRRIPPQPKKITGGSIPFTKECVESHSRGGCWKYSLFQFRFEVMNGFADRW